MSTPESTPVYRETRLRSVVKAVSWRCVGTLDTFLVSFVVLTLTGATEGNKAQDLPAFVANLDKGYAIIHSMLDDIEQVPRTSDKAKVLVPQWMTDYHLWEKDLKDWIELLRAGKIAQFGVAVTETGIPVNERINTFATENRIKACSTDLLTA
jgi:hypothetical protein